MIFLIMLFVVNVIQVIYASDISAGWTYSINRHAHSIIGLYLGIFFIFAYQYTRFIDIGNTYLVYNDRLIIKKILSKKSNRDSI